MQKYQSIISGTNGSVIRNVPVTVIKEDGSLADIFMDREGQVQAPNPLVTDSRGVFYFYAKNGRYSLRTAADGVQITDADTVLLFDPDETASDGPIADAVRRAEDAAERAETALGDSGLQTMVQNAQNAASDASQAVADANQAVASINTAIVQAGEAKEEAQAAAQTASEAAIDAQAVKDSLLDYGGALSATPEWSSVPAHVDLNFDTQAQALANRSELLRDNQKRAPLMYAAYAAASAAAATLPDGQAVVVESTLMRYDVAAGVLTNGRPTTPFTAVGGVTRSVQSKLSDTVSPMDFDAVGNGIADDTAAFATLEGQVRGADIDLCGRSYAVASIPVGNRYKNGVFVIGANRYSTTLPAFGYQPQNLMRDLRLSATRYVMTRIGAGAGNVVQGVAFDHVGGYAYTLNITGTPELGVINRYRSDGPTNQTAIDAQTGSNQIGHQGLVVEHLPDGGTRLISSAGSSVPEQGRKIVRFEYVPSGEPANVEIYTLFGAEFAAAGSTTPTLSPCGRFLVARGYIDMANFIQRIRVFDWPRLREAGPGDYSNAFLYEWQIDTSLLGTDYPLQGMACDGQNVYIIAGNSDINTDKRLHVYTLSGDVVQKIHNLTWGKSAAQGDGAGTFWEPEGLAMYFSGGASRPVLAAIFATGDSGSRLARVIPVGLNGPATFRNGIGPAVVLGSANDIAVGPGDTLWFGSWDGGSVYERYMIYDPALGLTFGTEAQFSRMRSSNAAGRQILEVRARTSQTDGAGANFYGMGDSSTPGAAVISSTNGTTVYQLQLLNNGNLQFGADNLQSLCTATRRATVVYAATGTINTSDEREKQQWREQSEAEKAAALEIKNTIKAFKWTDAVDAKGEAARWHWGVGAQTVGEILRKHGINPETQAFWCYDEWGDIYEPVMDTRTVLLQDGTEAVEEYDTGEVKLVTPAGNRYGIRYDQLVIFILAAI